MDVFLFIVMGIAILLLIAAVSRAVNNTGRLNVRFDGIQDGELLRLLRESQLLKQQGGVKSKSANFNLPETTRAVPEKAPDLLRKADQGLQS
jgi:hypothetical protein